MRYGYKAAAPEATISRITGILDTIGIKTKVETFKYSEGIHSSRVTIVNGALESCGLGCNGKGRTEAYALASAYAELMERIQNRVLGFEALKYSVCGYMERQTFPHAPFQKKTSGNLPFYYYPDEVCEFVDKEEIINLLQKYAPSNQTAGAMASLHGPYHLVLAPMYNLSSRKVVISPVEIMRYLSDSTGMCAGNNAAEAILQGLCEICERYVLQQLYSGGVEFPLLSSDLLSEESRDSLERLEANGFETRVLNCSMDGLFPVVGLLLHSSNGGYSFRLGSDLSPDVALSRCITEVFQGLERQEPIPLWKDNEEEFSILYEYHKSLVNGTGRIDLHKLDFERESAAYPFIDCDRRSEALLLLIDKFKDAGIEVFVRDNSYLKFPSYYVYSPQLSPVSEKLRPNIPFVLNQTASTSFFSLNPKYDIASISDNDARLTFETFLKVNVGKTLAMIPYCTLPDAPRYDINLLLFSFQVSSQRYRDAMTSLDSLKRTFDIDDAYYTAYRLALSLADQGASMEQMHKDIINICSDSEECDDIISDIFERGHALGYVQQNSTGLFVNDSAYPDWVDLQLKIVNQFDCGISQAGILDAVSASCQ